VAVDVHRDLEGFVSEEELDEFGVNPLANEVRRASVAQETESFTAAEITKALLDLSRDRWPSRVNSTDKTSQARYATSRAPGESAVSFQDSQKLSRSVDPSPGRPDPGPRPLSSTTTMTAPS